MFRVSSGSQAFRFPGIKSHAIADHYGSSELIFVRYFPQVDISLHAIDEISRQGQYRNSLPTPEAVICATKWCVFKPVNVTRAIVQAAVQERIDRTGSTSLDILQASP